MTSKYTSSTRVLLTLLVILCGLMSSVISVVKQSQASESEGKASHHTNKQLPHSCYKGTEIKWYRDINQLIPGTKQFNHHFLNCVMKKVQIKK